MMDVIGLVERTSYCNADVSIDNLVADLERPLLCIGRSWPLERRLVYH